MEVSNQKAILQFTQLLDNTPPRIINGFKVTEYPMKYSYLESLNAVDQIDVNCWGLDPGSANLGLAWFNPNYSLALAWEINGRRIPDATKRIIAIYDLIYTIMQPALAKHEAPSRAVIEGAGHGYTYGQPELAEVRSAIALLFELRCNIRTTLMPPHSIRKTVFGSAKVHAEIVYPLPANAAAALSCAMAAAMTYGYS